MNDSVINMYVVKNKVTGTEHTFGEAAWNVLKNGGEYEYLRTEQMNTHTGGNYSFTGAPVQQTGGCNC